MVSSVVGSVEQSVVVVEGGVMKCTYSEKGSEVGRKIVDEG